MNIGVSVIICCYNSEWIIERCLSALIKQKVSQAFKWEIIVVNNASSDNTVLIANNILQSSKIDYSIIDETTPGLLSARKCGVRHAKYSYLIFCDDDNLLCENYVKTMYEIMQSDKSIGAYGGRGIAEFESEPDSIIHQHIASYAIGSQKGRTNDLYGAGICVRKDCVEKIYNEHNFLLTGRCGEKLLAGDDSELVKTIIINGYNIGSTDDVSFIHVLPPKRLSYGYLCNMYKGFGLSAPILFIYDLCIEQKKFYLIYKFYVSMLIRYIIHSLILLFNKKGCIKVIYLKYLLKGFSFWGIHKLKTIYANVSNLNV